MYELLPDRIPDTNKGTGAGGADTCAGSGLVLAQLAEAEGDLESALVAYEGAAAAEQALFPSERGTAHVGAARCAHRRSAGSTMPRPT